MRWHAHLLDKDVVQLALVQVCQGQGCIASILRLEVLLGDASCRHLEGLHAVHDRMEASPCMLVFQAVLPASFCLSACTAPMHFRKAWQAVDGLMQQCERVPQYTPACKACTLLVLQHKSPRFPVLARQFWDLLQQHN